METRAPSLWQRFCTEEKGFLAWLRNTGIILIAIAVLAVGGLRVMLYASRQGQQIEQNRRAIRALEAEVGSLRRERH